MPLLTVTGGAIAPAGETLVAASLTVRYFSPYADGVNVYPTEHQAERDGVSGGWKPLGASDGVAFTIPGAADGDPMPPNCVLVERQEYASGGNVTFRYGPFRVYQTSAGEWIYGTAKAGIEFVVDADLPAAGALLTSQLGVAGGVAGLDGAGALAQAATAMLVGTAAVPGLVFTGDPDTGIYRDAADALGISAGGTQRALVDADGVEIAGGARVADGSAGTPAVRFTSDPDTGLYRVAADVLGLAAGGAVRAKVSNAAPYFTVNDGSDREVWHAGNVEVTSNADGVSIRFPNGVQICRRTVNLDSRTAYGSGTYSDPYRTATASPDFAQAFDSVPQLTMTAEVNTGGAAARAMAIASQEVSATGVLNVQAFAASSNSTSVDVTAHMLAIGTWS